MADILDLRLLVIQLFWAVLEIGNDVLDEGVRVDASCGEFNL